MWWEDGSSGMLVLAIGSSVRVNKGWGSWRGEEGSGEKEGKWERGVGI